MDNRDRANPFKEKALGWALISLVSIGTLLGIGYLIQGVEDWYWGPLFFYGFALFTWLLSYLLRNNP